MYSCFLECENNEQYSSILSPSLHPNYRSDMFYPSCRLVSSNQPICCIFRNIEKANALILKLAPKKKTHSSVYFFKSFRKYRISHNYPCHKSCHMPFLKFMPPFTLTGWHERQFIRKVSCVHTCSPGHEFIPTSQVMGSARF